MAGMLPDKGVAATNGHSTPAASGGAEGDESEIKLMENVKMTNGGGTGAGGQKDEGEKVSLTAVGKVRSKRFVNKKGFARRGIFMRNGTASWNKDAAEGETEGKNQFWWALARG